MIRTPILAALALAVAGLTAAPAEARPYWVSAPAEDAQIFNAKGKVVFGKVHHGHGHFKHRSFHHKKFHHGGFSKKKYYGGHHRLKKKKVIKKLF